MEQFFKNKSKREIEVYMWGKFLESVEQKVFRKQAAEFLDNILTANEKSIISRRLTALFLLKAGKSYKDVSRILWTSPSTLSALIKKHKKSRRV